MLPPNKGKLLSLDLGKRFTGVAVSDPSQRVVFPRDEIETKDFDILVQRLKYLIEKEQITGVIVGLPISSDGKETDQSQWVRKVMESLNTSKPVHFEDEAYTSVTLGIDVRGRKDSLVAQRLMEKVLGL
ncbi:MAG: putative Holliday junction resolvase [Oceanicoccus sp.]|jgi:putative Holliday junction resolvase